LKLNSQQVEHTIWHCLHLSIFDKRKENH